MVGNIANLSRVNPALLAVKGSNSYTKNMLHLYGKSSAPVLCFSLVLVMGDHHEHGRTFGSEPNKWLIKEIAGVLLTMELERLVAMLGLIYELPYVPDDGARREKDLLHLTMADNAFCFVTSMISKGGEFTVEFSSACLLLIFGVIYIIDSYGQAGPSSSKPAFMRKTKHDIFAPASPAQSGRVQTSASLRKPVLRASDTGMNILRMTIHVLF